MLNKDELSSGLYWATWTGESIDTEGKRRRLSGGVLLLNPGDIFIAHVKGDAPFLRVYDYKSSLQLDATSIKFIERVSVPKLPD